MYKKITSAVVGAALTLLSTGQSAIAFNLTTVATGLDSPRGMTFGPDGALYITEAGRGGDGACVSSPSIPGAVLCYGASSAITRVFNGTQQQVFTGLPSLAMEEAPGVYVDASGANDIAFDGTGTPYVIIGFASNPNNRDTVIGVSDFAQLVRIDNLIGGNTWTRIADLGTYEIDFNPDGGNPAQGGINSNPYALIIDGNTAYGIDAGGNDLLNINLTTNEIQTGAVFPERLVSHNIPGPPNPFPMQSVPTSIVKGNDGALYVGELTGFPFPQDGARIYRLNGSTPEVYLDGFTHVIDFAFTPDNYLYVLEYAANSFLTGNPQGALIQVAPSGDRRVILDDELTSPTALTVGPDGALYVTNNGFVAGAGEVLKVDSIPVPESSSLLALLTVAGIGVLAKKS